MSMLRYRMIALDIDGTLLNPQGHINPAVRAAVRAAVARGALVTLATGRRFHEAAAIAAELGLELPLVLHHGTLIQDSLTGEVLYEDALPDGMLGALVAEILDHGQQPVVHCSPASTHEVLTGPEAYDNSATAHYLQRQRQVWRLPHQELGEAAHALSVCVFHYDNALRPLYERLRSLTACTATFWQPGAIWSDYLIEVIHAQCSKASALCHLAAQYGIAMSEVMAVGDERNDLELIGAVGLGVAMGNAVPELRARAAVVVGSNAEDGVAEAIRRFVLS